MPGIPPASPWVFNLHDAASGIPRALAEGITARVFAGQQAMLSVVRFEPDAVGTVHSHPQEQWGLLVEGECVRIQDGEAVAMRAGDFWHTPGGVAHGIQAGPSGALVLDIFSPVRPEYTHPGAGFGSAPAADATR